MTVYVLTQEWEYEGEALLGVYASLEEARAAAQAYDSQGSDCLLIYERQVGAPAVLTDGDFVECI